MTLETFDKYKPAFDYIKANRPMHIVEYGGGQSTMYVNELLQQLDYGGKVTAFEDNPEFFDYAVKNGWNKNESINLVNTQMIDPDQGIIRYSHTLDEVEGVDFIILDGPDYRIHTCSNGEPSSITDNIEVLTNELGRDIPFWIEGRIGSQAYYRDLGYNMITEWDEIRG